MCSNRAAPSRDIALRLYGQELVRQLILDERSNDAASLVRFAYGFQEGTLLKLYGVEVKKKKLVPGAYQKLQVQRVKVFSQFADAAEILLGEEGFAGSSEVEYHSLRFTISNDSERIYPGSFVRAAVRIPSDADDDGPLQWTCVPMFSVSLDAHGVRKLSYGQENFLIPITAILNKINIVHDCAAHECPITNTRLRRQERETVSATTYEVSHNIDDDPQTAILNDTLCRSGWEMHHMYQVLPATRSLEDVIRSL
ncbi:unnamed protein product [Tilletia caries]|uniref:Arrestin-like N-terminal domain-containing protein n=1 Tax=Tilletia caries TaxID=13290 RepID=A0ABN7J2X1_9BASI|nr:unnamed protein product [Tilletia caries]